jgi:hypothetical protein
MAKLKIKKAGSSKEPVVEEYINVVDGLFPRNAGGVYTNYDEFIDADPDERPNILQRFIAGPIKITHQPESGNPQVINNNNCLIFTERDRKKKGGRRSRVTVPMPDAPPENDIPGRPAFEYLMVYANAIADLHSQIAGPNDLDNIEKCTRFMFGMMLLTRCR